MNRYRHLTAAELVRRVQADDAATPLERELADRLARALRAGGTANQQGLPTAGSQGVFQESEGGTND